MIYENLFEFSSLQRKGLFTFDVDKTLSKLKIF